MSRAKSWQVSANLALSGTVYVRTFVQLIDLLMYVHTVQLKDNLIHVGNDNGDNSIIVNLL